MSTLPVDWQEREAALDTRSSFLVEAPAGSGKTALLVQRYLKLLLDEEVQEPEQVLAITFTVKATEEIRNRVLGLLQKARDQQPATSEYEAASLQFAAEVQKRDTTLNWRLLERPTRMNVRSIDSLAAEIARTLPILSGSFGALQPTNLPEPLYRLAARQTLMQMGGSDTALDEALRMILLHRDTNLRDVELLLAQMLQQRDQWIRLVPLSNEELSDLTLDHQMLPRLDAALQKEVCQRMATARSLFSENMASRLAIVLHGLSECDGYGNADNPLRPYFTDCTSIPDPEPQQLEAWNALIHLLLTKEGWRSTKGLASNHLKIDLSGKGHEIKELKQALQNLLTDLPNDALLAALMAVRHAPPTTYPRDQWPIAKALLRVLRHALGELRATFAEAGACDFTEVSLAAEVALQAREGASDFAAAYGMKLRHLVMDEMQDTSANQYALLQLLTAGWDGHSQTVFLVGDPKQSIYLFREARVDLFLKAIRTKHFGDIPLSVLQLTSNFRSQTALVADFNRSFTEIFAPQPEGIAYTEVSAMKPELPYGLQWHTALLVPSHEKSDTAPVLSLSEQKTTWETNEIVQRIVEWKQCHPEKKKPAIAVLVRSRSHAIPILSALREAHIPSHAVEMETLMERAEILDLLALTRAMLHPADRVATLAVFHAPWCGAGLADLHSIAGGDMVAQRKSSILHLIAERLHLVSERSRLHVQRTAHVLQAAIAQRGRMPLATWVEKAWRSLGADLYLEKDALQNARSYFSMLESIDATGHSPSIPMLEDRLRKLYATSRAEDGAVQVLTIHKSKGLEWDLVLVPSLEMRTRAHTASFLSWKEIVDDEHEHATVMFAPIAAKGYQATALVHFVNEEKKQREQNEVARLFYVAATRAASSLHLFGALKAKKNGDPSPFSGTLLHAAWASAQQEFASPQQVFTEDTETIEQEEPASNRLEWPTLFSEPSNVLDSIAASSTAISKITRFPLGVDPSLRWPTSSKRSEERGQQSAQTFDRAEGSYLARAIGDTVHVFLEQLAKRAISKDAFAELQQDVPQWLHRMERYALSHGIPTSHAKRAAATALQALTTMLTTSTGQWILETHPMAASEMPLLASSSSAPNQTFRLDRTFLAGALPEQSGASYRWIIDFKTADRKNDVDAFLLEARSKYQGQMHSYAQAMRATHRETRPIMLGLYYPLMNRLDFWRYEDTLEGVGI